MNTEELTAEYEGRKYREPPDDRVIVISHVNQIGVTDLGPVFEAIYDVMDPKPGDSGKGHCTLEYLQSLHEIK